METEWGSLRHQLTQATICPVVKSLYWSFEELGSLARQRPSVSITVRTPVSLKDGRVPVYAEVRTGELGGSDALQAG